ncbi:probable serine/threonine-protein kinase ifkC isoform X2 [Montipora foliosa]|uniref:probable serine/threonine-protein kinase ifkC isoform X2 n=1 Tax=Montipora foliosa TaxID=591990 RepID=UPI0035F1F0E8
MSANEASLGTFDPGLDDAFEQFGPVDVDAFIDSQFNYALEGQEELQNTEFSKTAVGSRNELQMAASETSTLHSIEFSLGGTQTNSDKANSFVSSLDELQMNGFSGMCSQCHKVMDKKDVVSYQTRKCETKERTFDPRSAIATELQLSEISDDVGTCWRKLGPKLNIAAAKIHNLDEDYKNNHDKANALLLMWKQQEGNTHATVGRLADHLKAIGRTSIAEKLLGVADVQLPTCSVEKCDVINLTVKCDLNGELDSKVMLCEDASGNKFLLRPVNGSMGNWNPEEIQKNKAFLETVAAAAKDMGKTPEQRRQESLKRISSEVQELQQKLKKVKLDLGDSKECTDSFTAGENKQNDREAEKEVLDHDAKVPQQDVNHLLQSCEEQQSFCQGIYSALIKLIGEVGQPRDDNFKCISQLCDFTKELKDREKALSPKIELLNNMKDCLDMHQTTKLEKLDKWYRAQQEQIDGVEKLLSSLLSQGNIAKKQKMLKRRSEPVLGGKPSSGFSRGRSKTDSSKNSGKSLSLCELQSFSKKSSISEPLCPYRMCVMDTDKKLKKGQLRCAVNLA